jgi:hypothetical protein
MLTALLGLSLRVALAVASGVVFCAAWTVLFIFGVTNTRSTVVRASLWLLAPVITAAGFAVGRRLSGQGPARDRLSFGRAYPPVLAACAIGALSGAPFGPMFIGLGMVGAATIVVIVWEYTAMRRAQRG